MICLYVFGHLACMKASAVHYNPAFLIHVPWLHVRWLIVGGVTL